MHVNLFSVAGFHSIYCHNVEVRVYDKQSRENNLLYGKSSNENTVSFRLLKIKNNAWESCLENGSFYKCLIST